MRHGFKVVLTKGTTDSVYGTYDTQEQAEEIAKAHRGRGYWTRVTVEKV